MVSKFVECRFDCVLQGLQIVAYYAPNYVGIDLIILVPQYISHRADLRPRLVGYHRLD
jgi:hypothetical protein